MGHEYDGEIFTVSPCVISLVKWGKYRVTGQLYDDLCGKIDCGALIGVTR